MLKRTFFLTATIVFMTSILYANITSAAIHKVKAGEDLGEIAEFYGITIDELLQLNGLINVRQAVVGYELTVPDIEVKAEQKEEPKAKPVAEKAAVQAKEEKKEEKIEDYTVVKTLTVEATAYTPYCKGCSGISAYGINLRKESSLKVIAVDPKVIALGTKVWVEGYGIAIAGDTGGAIKGNKIDVLMNTKQEAYSWGRKKVTIKVLK